MTAVSPQTRASDPGVSAFVAANAGSGKTSTLVDRVARLLLRGAPPGAVLCVTYTKAAASEMQRRLFDRLGGWAVLGDAELTGELARIGEAANDLATARKLFARALETPGGLKIQTLHGFCEQLLRRFPIEAGVSPGFAVLEDAAAHAVSAQAREALALEALRDPDGAIGAAYAHLAVALDLRTFETLLASFETDREQIAAYAQACDAAGFGWAQDVWRRCGYDDVPDDPDAVEAAAVALCDWGRWRDAAQALQRTGKPSDAKLATALATHAEAAGGALLELARPFFTGEGAILKTLGTKDVDADVRAWLQQEATRLHGDCARARGARQAQDTVHALTLALAHAGFYDAAKRARGGLDFGDLITAAEDLLTHRADAAWVLYKLDGGVDHLLLDEAQDTSPRQWSIVRSLTDEFFAGAGGRAERLLARTVFVVGDQKQSIYSFQGAVPERLATETQAYLARAEGAGAPLLVTPLVESWRSTPQVLAFVDAVFADPSTRAAVAPAPGEAVVRHTVGGPRVDHPGGVELWEPFRDEPAEPGEAWDAPLDAPSGETGRKKLARAVAGRIRDMIAAGEAVFDPQSKAWRPVRPGDVLILVRARGGLFEEIIRTLKTTGVPVAGADRLKLSEHIVFQDMLALIRFALFPWDDLTLAALLRSPFCDVDEGGLYALAQGRGDGRNLWAELSRRGDERPEWDAARGLLSWARGEAATRGPFDFLGRALGRLDGAGRTLRQRILTRLGPEAEDALEAMLAQALAAEARGVTDLERFAAALDAAEVEVKRELEGSTTDEIGQVRVMTVHGAKGLEAPIVILPDATRPATPTRSGLIADDDGLIYSARVADDVAAAKDARDAVKARQAAEGLRLLYVALTRARDRLIVCGRLSASGKVPADSWYARVEAGLAQPQIAAHTRILDVGGLTVRRFGPDPLTIARARTPAPPAAPIPAWLTRPAPREADATRYASPSTHAERERGAAPSPLAAAGGLGRFRRGELIHRLLQLLPELGVEARPAAAARLLERERDLSAEHRREMAAAALGVLADARFAEVFGAGSRAEAAVAGTAPDLPPGLAISGRVDRMVVGPERVLVVDFKTNRPSPDRIDAADPAYLVQMALYVAVLRAVFPKRHVEAALVWTDGPKLMPIPESLIASSLAGLRRSG